MRTNLEIAAELIAADVRNLNDIETYCGYPDFNQLDAIERDRLSKMVNELLVIIHRRQEHQRIEWENA